MNPDKPAAYVICSNPRSGTTLLCQMLRDAGAGQPDSFFRPHDIGFWAQEWGLPWPDEPSDLGFQRRYLGAMIVEGRGDSRTFGLRLMAEDLDSTLDWLARCHPGHERSAALFDAAFGPTQFFHLSRQDKLAEAVSLIRAQQSGLWHRHADGSVLEQTDASGPLRYDAKLIAEQMRTLREHDARWTKWFQNARTPPLQLTYEALAQDPQSILALALDHIGIDASHAIDVTPGTARLTDDVTLEWISRYQAEQSA